MKKYSRLLVIGMLATVLVSVVSLVKASAQTAPMTEEQIGRIRTNCVSVKNTLTQLHASDALLRVNRGQIYLSMTTKLMNRFNSRVDSNRGNAKDLMSVTDSYSVALVNFQNDYRAYEEQLSSALKLDCTKEPVAFYDAVASARTKRTQVYVDVVTLHQYIDVYKSTFDTFVTEFKVQGRDN